MKWRLFLSCIFLLGLAAGLGAQDTPNSTKIAQPASANVAVVSKPVRKPDQVITNDTIGLLAVRRAPRVTAATTAESTAAREEIVPEDVESRKAAEIASIEQQIKDKQKRVGLLMKLFVSDEKEFLKNAGKTETDPVAQERRRYEQDELRWETAEVARLQARLAEIRNEAQK